MEAVRALTVNLFGGPGSGKTTVAAGVFGALRSILIPADFATEYAKELVIEKHWAALNNQIHVFGEQHRRIMRCQNMVDVVVTDSPLMLTCVYGENYPHSLWQLAYDEHRKTRSVNYFIERPDHYEALGRSEDLERSKKIDGKTIDVLNSYQIKWRPVHVYQATEIIVHDLRILLGKDY